MDFIDERYINLLSSHLDKLTKKSNNLYNCRCPFCGDSHLSKIKARGYFYQKNGHTKYKCHNCSLSTSFSEVVKSLDGSLYHQYCLEKFSSEFKPNKAKKEIPIISISSPVFNEKINLPRASENYEAHQYLTERKINSDRFFFAENFKTWTNSLRPHTFDSKSLYYEESRIVIPLYIHKKLVGFQGRSIAYNDIKYITIMLDENNPKIYGYDDLNLKKDVYILEGAFDSTFVSNSVAMCGADTSFKNLSIDNPIYIYDNEPRNIEIHSRMKRSIRQGNRIVIWPNKIKQKDINDMVLNGLNVMNIIQKNTFVGLEATLHFNFWKKR